MDDTVSIAESVAPENQEGFDTNGSMNPDTDEDFSDIASYCILVMPGTDTQGNPVFCFKAANMPTDPKIDFNKLLRYMKSQMDSIVESDYSIIYLHRGLNSKNKPPFSWLRQVYSSFGRKYKKNLKALYLVHASSFIKVVLTMLKPLLSKKFYKKIHFVSLLQELEDVISVRLLGVPEEVRRHDDSMMAKAAAKGKQAQDSSASPESLVFGAKLDSMNVNENGIPEVVQSTMDMIRKVGLDTEGIFRRSVSLKTIKAIKQLYNEGSPVNLEEYRDPQLAAALLKCFFRELSEPLLTFKLYKDFLKLNEGTLGEQQRTVKCKKLLDELPEKHRVLLNALLNFLSEVALHAEQNKMGKTNLAIVFAPNILRSQDETEGLMSTGKVNDAVRFIIDHHSDLL